jgi:hypothetical protein
MYKRILFIVICSLSIVGCSNKGSSDIVIEQPLDKPAETIIDDNAIAKNEESSIAELDQEIFSIMQVSEEELKELGITKDEAVELVEKTLSKDEDLNKYKFSNITGKCMNSKREVGLNKDITECGDIRSANIDAKEIDKKKLYGLNMEGTFITKGKFRYGRIANDEYKYDEKTVFEGQKDHFKKLVNAHTNIYKKQETNLKKGMVVITKLRKRVDLLMDRYEKISNEAKKKKILKIVVKVKKSIYKRNRSLLLLANKKTRHKKYSINTQAMVP